MMAYKHGNALYCAIKLSKNIHNLWPKGRPSVIKNCSPPNYGPTNRHRQTVYSSSNTTPSCWDNMSWIYSANKTIFKLRRSSVKLRSNSHVVFLGDNKITFGYLRYLIFFLLKSTECGKSPTTHADDFSLLWLQQKSTHDIYAYQAQHSHKLTVYSTPVLATICMHLLLWMTRLDTTAVGAWSTDVTRALCSARNLATMLISRQFAAKLMLDQRFGSHKLKLKYFCKCPSKSWLFFIETKPSLVNSS